MDNTKLLWTVTAASVVAVGVGAFSFAGSKAEDNKAVKAEEEGSCWESHVDDNHGVLEEIYPGILYRLEAPGCEYGPPVRNMTIYRPPAKKDQEEPRKLLIYSAIAVKEDTLQEILALGVPSVMVVPNDMHRCCAGVWKKRFPDLKVICPPKARPKVEEKIPVDCTLEELTVQDAVWKDYLSVKHIAGWMPFEDVLEVWLSDQKIAMVVCDSLFTISYDHDAGLGGRVIQWIFDSHVEPPKEGQFLIPKVSRLARWFVIQDWKQVEAWYRSYAHKCGKNIYAILVAHGPPVVELDPIKGCTDALLGVADQLVKPHW